MNYFSAAMLLGHRVLNAGLVLLMLLWANVVAGQRLTDDGRLKMDPVCVDGGREIVFTVQEKYNQLSLMQLNLSSRAVRRLHPAATTSEFSPSFSADGRHYAYVQNDGNLHVKLVIRDAQRATEVTYNPGGGFAGIRNLSMAPDGSRVVFAFPEKGFEQQIFSLDRNAKTRLALTGGDGFDACPQFSPDGRWIAMASARSGNFDIYTMDADGKQIHRLTDHPGLDTRPAWSPDGKRIAYTSLREGNFDIYVVHADGSQTTRVTVDPERDDYACWHPDGRRLVVVSERNGSHDLYLVDVPD